ncbi:MAG: aspartate kinase, partial [Vicinamibacterales bacterium]
LLLESTAPMTPLLALLDERGLAAKQLQHRAGRTSLVVSRENLHDESHIRQQLAEHFGEAVTVRDGLGAVSAIGAGINASFAHVRQGTALLADGGIAVDDLTTSSFRITWMVQRDDLQAAVRLLHRAFIDRVSEPTP